MQECKHNYEVQFSIWCGALYKCTKCEAMLYLKRKYTGFLFIIGFIGWLVPYVSSDKNRRHYNLRDNDLPKNIVR